MKLAWLLKKFRPRYLVAGGIAVATLLVLAVWSMTRSRGGSEPVASEELQAAPAFEAADVILCGNALVNFRNGELLAEQWLEGFGNDTPNITGILPEQRLVIVTGGNGIAGAFGFDGKAKPVLEADGKPVGAAGFNKGFSQAVYVKDGDLWHGNVDWAGGKIGSPQRITETGYFRADAFRSRWLWHEDNLLIPAGGKTLEIMLSTGAVKEVRLDLGLLEHGMSPLGTFAVVPVGGRELGVVDLLTGESKNHNVGQRIRKFLWLTPEKVAMHIGINQLAQYDHELKKLEGPQQADGGIADIVAPSPDGSCFLVIGGNEIGILDLKEKKSATLKLPFTQVEWVSDEELLCSFDGIDTDKRGLWLVKKTGEMERLSPQPVDASRGTGGKRWPLARIPGGALFISGGNLWSFDGGAKTVKQITQDRKLAPSILQLAAGF